MEKQEQEELKSRRNVAAKQGQRTRQKDCEEREMGKARGRKKGDGGKVDGNQCHKGERMPHLLST